MLQPLFNTKDIEKAVNKRLNYYKKKLTNTLCYMGEICIYEAVNNGNYENHTYDLRNSIGYIVLDNGKTVKKNILGKYNPLISTLKKEYNKGLVLIVVAGEKYGLYVEAKGYNVLASSNLLLEKELPSLLKQITT